MAAEKLTLFVVKHEPNLWMEFFGARAKQSKDNAKRLHNFSINLSKYLAIHKIILHFNTIQTII